MCAPNCDTTISNLQSQISQLNVQVTADQTQIISLQAQIASDQEVLGLSKQIILVDSTTYNWVACGGTSQPSCNGVDTMISPSYSYPSTTKFYAGYLSITWSSTAPLNLVVQSPGFIPVQTSSSATTALVAVSPKAPVTGLPFMILWQVAEPPCTVGIITGNHACPSGTITYSITYYY